MTKNLALAAVAGELAAARGVTTAEVAISWMLRHPAITAAIVGARRQGKVEGVIRAAEIEWAEDEDRRITAAIAEHARSRS